MRDLGELFDLPEETIFALILGFMLGTFLIFATRSLMHELIEIEDQAARRRLRDLFEEMRQARDEGAAAISEPQPIDCRRAQAPQDIVFSEGPRLIAVNSDDRDREAAKHASDAGTDAPTD